MALIGSCNTRYLPTYNLYLFVSVHGTSNPWTEQHVVQFLLGVGRAAGWLHPRSAPRWACGRQRCLGPTLQLRQRILAPGSELAWRFCCLRGASLGAPRNGWLAWCSLSLSWRERARSGLEDLGWSG